MYDVEGLLLNVLVLVFFLLFVPLVMLRNRKSATRHYKKKIFIVSSSLAIMTCITFPIDYSDGFFYDLRFVAQIIGSLYGGLPASVILWVITVGYRGIFGGLGVYSTLIVSTTILFLTVLFRQKFFFASKKKKVTMGACFSIITSSVVILNTMFLFNLPVINSADVAHFILQLCSIVSLIYIMEVARETTFINKRIIKAEKMEVVSHLASSISHEVRNPLAVVRGFLQMMQETDLPIEKRKEFLKISIDEIDRANDIIRNYLTFAKPSPENVEILNIKQELERAIEIIKPLANMNCVEIATNIHQSYVKGESQLLQQCLLNITKNCIEAMPNSGVLHVRTEEKHDQLLIEIVDSGTGMTEEQLSRLGEPYFTTKGRDGTGLGMMAAIKIIELMNGKIQIHSKINVGTNFEISLPRVSIVNEQIAATTEE
ncbi:sensor histidine kinase [Anaerobacillus alkaliphilus]|uniref:histidine kinase n=1 Tax=Anaerobacillus alkaliphilus TaxID=1548597 RepID=A0A4Q0VQX3_9BACI|nr:HAMP domain-containing sensor histidine kinase [Anaerobacillus alkaliphilus]RXI98609.1 sensor histidine kinase [Anaerobacillus alkaliphilus]